ncbi:hypothetical protein PR001_g19080 [Phytophthora rubi]|uniref:CCHC-type domain-containing protein n=1 Tax=Phytophthora rubi TaxID=129364 RepID=A0A6A3JZN7_9STRA|nr:hypothetical protein PR001_g19080 [Phytophthora rubi]
MTVWDEREVREGRGPLATAAKVQDQEQSGLIGNLGNVVSGYGAMWGAVPTPPRRFESSNGRPRGKRAHGGQPGGQQPEQGARKQAKTFKVEGTQSGELSGRQAGPKEPLRTREERLRNQEAYNSRRTDETPFLPRPGTVCFYCGYSGHFVRNCKLKEEGLAASGASQNQEAKSAGNEPRA